MTKQEAIDHFGDIRALSSVLDVWPHTIYKWGEFPPLAQQYVIHVKSGFKLIPEDMKSEENNKKGSKCLQ